MPRLIHITTVPHTLHFLIGQVEYMREKGLDVEAISSSDSKLEVFLQQEPIRHHAIAMSRSLSPFRDMVACWKLYRTLRSRQPDIVHVHTPKAGLLGMIAACFANVPVRIHHIHGLRFTTLTGWRRRLVMLCEKAACTMAHRVYCVSPSAMQVATQNKLVDPQRVRVLLNGSINGIDAEEKFAPDALPPALREQTRQRLGIPSDAVTIGFIGRFVKDKGITELARAWKILRNQVPNAHLLLVGYFESLDPLDTAIRKELEQDERVHISGYDPETPPLYGAMDVFCLPTYREGLPYVLLEASAMRLPIVATRVTGCVDAVRDGHTGTLVTPRDAQAIATALIRYCEDASLRSRHGQCGREFVRTNFHPQSMWQAVLQEYTESLQQARRPTPIPAVSPNAINQTKDQDQAA